MGFPSLLQQCNPTKVMKWNITINIILCAKSPSSLFFLLLLSSHIPVFPFSIPLSLSPSLPHFLDVCGSCPISGHLLVCEVRKEEACDSFIYIKLSVESSWKSWTMVFVFKIFHFGHKVHFFLALIICLSLTLSVFLITKKGMLYNLGYYVPKQLSW